jgi:uncharacterized phage protein (TIGR01671 family)
MREIKFRAKRLDNGEWAYGYGLIIADDFCVLDKRDELYIQRLYTFRGNTHWFELCGIMCDTNTLCQFTGLHDKSGKDIYEGDIIGCLNPDIKHLVFYNEKQGRFMAALNGDIDNDFVAVCGLDDSRWNASKEVIVNIHDNPELLKSL